MWLHPTSEWAVMSDRKTTIGDALRLISSEGWAGEDAEVVSELLERAQALAELVLADPSTSPEARAIAEDLVERFRSDLVGR